VVYGPEGRAAKAMYFLDEAYYDFVYLDPCSGEVLAVRNEYSGFFRFILDGHFYLWLPRHLGQTIVAWSTLVFVVMLVTGLILWWPRNRHGRKQRFSLQWSGRWRRKNYALHNVLGFYVLLVGLLLAFTGLVWGFEWFRNSVYRTAGGERSLQYEEPASDTLATVSSDIRIPSIDLLWHRCMQSLPRTSTVEVHFPATASSPVMIAVNRDPSTYWRMDYLFYDQYTLEELPVEHVYGRFEHADKADKLMRMNYDLHVGAIWGFPGKLIMFLASLIVASLPVTGVFIWIGRLKKKRSPAPANSAVLFRKAVK
jgi:uncharacterized iron-regulated membrane protein